MAQRCDRVDKEVQVMGGGGRIIKELIGDDKTEN